MILILKHIDIEGPGTLGDFLKKKNEPFRVADLGAGETLSMDLKGLKAVVVLGGPMNVYEEEKFVFLKQENQFIQQVLKEKLPFLGICLGAQLLAKAAGARVIKSPVKEIGWYHVKLTDAGREDPFLKGFREEDAIFHWHEDMFEIPVSGKLLATASGCPHQAYRVGPNAYGIQFHVEITDSSISQWCDEYCRNNAPERQKKSQELLDGYTIHKERFDGQAERLYENFLELLAD